MKLMPKGLQDKVSGMVGKSYVYKNEVVRVLQARIVENTVEIVTEKGWLNYSVRTAVQELEKFVPTLDGAALETKPIAVALYESNGVLNTMRASVLDMIDRLKTDPNLVPQANAINGLLQTAIAMGKMELEAARLNWQMQESART